MFSIDEVQKIANLSNLELTDEEKKTFARQFSTILDYFKVLDSLDVPPEFADRDESMLVIFQDDHRRLSPVAPEHFSPYTENGCFKVPKVIDAS